MNLTRRTLVVAAGLAAGLPGLTRAQTAPARVRRIGMVANSAATPPGQPSRYAMAFIGELQAQPLVNVFVEVLKQLSPGVVQA